MKRYKLGEICEIVSGSTPKTSIPEYWDGDIKWITPAEINDDSYIITDTVRKITKLGVEKTGLSSFPKDTVILSSRAPIGKVAIAGCDMYCNQGFKNLICSTIINSKYLYWFLKGKNDYLNKLGRGATFKEISKQIVSEIEIDLPAIEKQEEVASILLNIKRIINLRKEEIKLFDNLIKARFVEISSAWDNRKEAEPLANYLEEITYGFTNPMPDSDTGPWKITAKDIMEGRINLSTARKTNLEDYDKLSKKSKPRINDILLTKDGTLGRVALVDIDNICINQSVALLRCNSRTLPKFLFSLLQMPVYQTKMIADAGGVTIKHIYITRVDKMLVTIPEIREQKKWVEFVTQVDKSKAVVQQSLDKTQLLFDSLMQQYFG